MAIKRLNGPPERFVNIGFAQLHVGRQQLTPATVPTQAARLFWASKNKPCTTLEKTYFSTPNKSTAFKYHENHASHSHVHTSYNTV